MSVSTSVNPPGRGPRVLVAPALRAVVDVLEVLEYVP
jgi:hypothetical protein